MTKHKYSCESCKDITCWLCTGNVYYDKVMKAPRTEDTVDHKRDVAEYRDFIKHKGCASNTVLLETQRKMLELLQGYEWAGSHTDYDDSWGVMTRACPICFNAKEDGHKSDCQLVILIKELS